MDDEQLHGSGMEVEEQVINNIQPSLQLELASDFHGYDDDKMTERFLGHQETATGSFNSFCGTFSTEQEDENDAGKTTDQRLDENITEEKCHQEKSNYKKTELIPEKEDEESKMTVQLKSSKYFNCNSISFVRVLTSF